MSVIPDIPRHPDIGNKGLMWHNAYMDTYRAVIDNEFSRFAAAHLVDGSASVTAADAYAAYLRWEQENPTPYGLDAMSRHMFGRQMGERYMRRKVVEAIDTSGARTKTAVVYYGVTLR